MHSGRPDVLASSERHAPAIYGPPPITRLQAGAASPLAVGLVLGGSLANVAERLVRGAVTDFIRLPWIVFDAADLAASA